MSGHCTNMMGSFMPPVPLEKNALRGVVGDTTKLGQHRERLELHKRALSEEMDIHACKPLLNISQCKTQFPSELSHTA